MKYTSYSTEDFVLDQHFRKWVLDPDQPTHDFWEAWLIRHPHKAQAVHQARELLLHLPEVRHVYSQEREDRLWDKIAEKVSSPATKGKVIPLPVASRYSGAKERRRHSWVLLTKGSIAASLLVIISFVAAFYWVSRETEPAQPQWVVKENPYGQRSTIYLNDGTEIMLNAGSSLRYREKFSANQRKVELTGEAFFQVAKDSLRPFEVVANHVVTRALGTSFNVSAFPEEPLQVSLVTGKVLVFEDHEGKRKGLILLPGESAVSSPEHPGSLTKGVFDKRQTLSWKEGAIYFQEADEKTVFTTLERWYGVSIRTLNTSPKPWEYSGEAKNMSLEQFLQSLSYTMHFHYRIDDKQITIEYDE